MTLIEKNTIRLFGTPNRKETIDRIYRLASTAREPEIRKQLFALCLKLDREDADKWYGCLYYKLSIQLCKLKKQSGATIKGNNQFKYVRMDVLPVRINNC